MYQQLRVAVVIPAYNEERAIGEVVARVPAYVDQVLVVDDASADATADHARAAGAVRGATEVLVHDQNRGVGGAIVTGYRRALALGADAIAVMAGDGQMDPADLPALLDPIAAGVADYVKGNRFRHPEVWSAMPPARIVGNLVLSAATKVTSGYTHVFDSQCGYTVASAAALRAIDLDRVFPRYGYPNDLLSHLHTAAMRVRDVPVRPVYGPAWKSGINLGTALHPIPWVLFRSWSARVATEARARWRARA
ncbi:MAG: glycosyltransferase family 2 protein [Myxococcales bacterium]|nr:glycosyltransferase family 2 protein [Myxococcales bacterium]